MSMLEYFKNYLYNLATLPDIVAYTLIPATWNDEICGRPEEKLSRLYLK
jgi:hypothetical protein